jgi:hypothetical protein
MSKKTMKLALEALKSTHDVGCTKTDDAIKALEEELANHIPDATKMIKQEHGEPVACANGCSKFFRYTTPQPKQEQVEQEENRLIQERDHAHEIIDKLCDAVLGFERHEWSSAYFFEDAVNEVEEKMWQLAKQEQGEPCDMKELCIGCSRKLANGQCPGTKLNGACSCYVTGFNDGMKEMDGMTPYQEQGEPVAWVKTHTGGVSYDLYHDVARQLPEGVKFDLYTHPQPKREPLTDEQCTWKQNEDPHMPDTWEADCGAMWTFTEGGPKDNDMKFCPNCGKPTIEAAHGIKE